MIGDPWESLRVIPWGPLIRLPLRTAITHRTRRDCRSAAVVSYVTREALQRRYPPGPTAFVTHASDVDLPPTALVAHPRIYRSPARELVSVGSLEVDYKGIDVLLDALRRFPGETRPRLTVIGGGRLLNSYADRAHRLGLADHVRFTGTISSGNDVRAELDAADVFVMPSLTEGLPKAMIEAMARGLPCIGSNVGGIPELLRPSELVAPGDAKALHMTLANAIADPRRLTRLSRQNLETAHAYAAERLALRREEMYRAVLECTGR
jgi:glycosyltransferase involved in cell wall biosynthesis